MFRAHNIQFLKEKYYSPSLNKTYLADLPAGYCGEFGPQLKAFALKQYFDSNMTQRNILVGLFMDADVKISAGQLSNLLIKDQDIFHQEKDALYQAGLNSSPWQHIDDTSTRVNGQNHYCQILCNPLYTAYFTTKHKSRLIVLPVCVSAQAEMCSEILVPEPSCSTRKPSATSSYSNCPPQWCLSCNLSLKANPLPNTDSQTFSINICSAWARSTCLRVRTGRADSRFGCHSRGCLSCSNGIPCGAPAHLRRCAPVQIDHPAALLMLGP